MQLAYKINNVLICWTPKCACTSIWKLLQRFYKKEFDRFDTRFCVQFDENKLKEFENKKKIIIVRNPYYRILSAYLNKLVVNTYFFPVIYIDKF